MNKDLTVHTNPAEQRVADARLRLMLSRINASGAASSLRAELKENIQWRTWFRRDPGLFLGLAFAVGFLAAHRRRF